MGKVVESGGMERRRIERYCMGSATKSLERICFRTGRKSFVWKRSGNVMPRGE